MAVFQKTLDIKKHEFHSNNRYRNNIRYLKGSVDKNRLMHYTSINKNDQQIKIVNSVN